MKHYRDVLSSRVENAFDDALNKGLPKEEAIKAVEEFLDTVKSQKDDGNE